MGSNPESLELKFRRWAQHLNKEQNRVRTVEKT